MVKNPPAYAGDGHKRCGFDPWVGRLPGGGNGSPLHYSCLENPMDRRACRLQSIRLQRVGHYWSSLAFLCLHKIENTADSDYFRVWEPLSWSRPSRTNTPKRCPFHYRGLEFKIGKSRNIWNNRHIWPWSTEWSRAKANRVWSRECTGHSEHSCPTIQEKTLHMNITRWPIPNQIDYILCSQRRKTLYSQQK